MNAVDQQRTIPEVEQLLLLALRLGYRNEVAHWRAVLDEKKRAAW